MSLCIKIKNQKLKTGRWLIATLQAAGCNPKSEGRPLRDDEGRDKKQKTDGPVTNMKEVI
jgi:hypothetical protein